MAKRTIENFTVQISANDQKFQQTLASSAGNAKRWATSVRKAINTGFLVGGGAAIVAMTALVKKTSETIDAQAKFADVIGLTTEQFAGLQVAAQITGVELTQVNTAITRMLKNVGDAEDGLSTATNAFGKLGLSASELKKLETADQIKLIADRFTELKSPVEKASVLINVFGRAGINFGKLLEQGAVGIQRFEDEARSLGLAISRVDAAKVEAANDSLARANFIINAAGRSLSVELAPAIELVANNLVKVAKEAGGMGKAVTDAVQSALYPIGVMADGIYAISLLFEGLGVLVSQFSAAFLNILAAAPRIKNAIKDALGFDADPTDLNRIFVAWVDNAKASADDAGKAFQEKLLAPIPSQKIKQFFDDIAAASDAAANSATIRPAIDLSMIQGELDLENFFAGFTPAQDKLFDAFVKTRTGMEQEISLFGDVSKAAKLRYDLENGELSKLSESKKQILIDLAVNLDSKEADVAGAEAAAKIEQENANVVSLQQEKFKRMREMALQASGLNRQLEDERFASEISLLEEQSARILNFTTLSLQEKTDITAQFQQAEREAAIIHAKNLTDIEKEEAEKRTAIKMAQLDAVGNFFGLLGNLAEEGSKAQRIAFAAEKAVAIAKALTNLQVAISNASTLPPPLNFAAMATAAATGAGIVANVRAIGVAHGGLNLADVNMRQDEMTIIAQRGERIVSRDQNRDLTDMIAQQNTERRSAGGVESAPANVGVFIDGESMMNFVSSQRGGAAVMEHIAFNKDEVNTILGRG